MQIELSYFLEHLWPAVRARVGFKNEFEKTTLKTMHWAENNYLCLLFVVSLSFKCFWVDYASVYKISKSQESIFKSFEGPSPASFSFWSFQAVQISQWTNVKKIYLHPALRFELHTSRPEASPPYHLMYTLSADIDHVPVCTNQTSLTSKLRSRCRRSNV